MPRPWLALLRQLALWFLAATLLGVWSGAPTLTLLAAALIALAWQGWQLYRLERWVGGGLNADPPRLEPVWREMAAGIVRLRQQSRKRKRRLSKALKQFRQAAAALPDAAVLLDEASRIVWCNEAAYALLGLTLPRDAGRPIAHLVRYPPFLDFLSQSPGRHEVELPAPIDGERVLRARLAPYGKKQRLLLAADVSQFRRLEQVRRDFVANVSHELRTPLTVITGYLETLLDSEHPGLDPWRQPLRGMSQQAGRMLHLIEDLLWLARLETQKDRLVGKPVAVPKLLADIVEEAQALSGEQAHCITLRADPQVWLAGVEKELHSAFSNLVVNAVRYTPAGGVIEVRWFADAAGVHLEVEDDGEGIAPQHLPRLTERFYRVNRDRSRSSGGTGLGLSIVKHILNHYGGQLQIQSEVGAGSVFRCDFPAEARLTPPPIDAQC